MRPGEVFYCADEFDIGWHPTPPAMWSPVGHRIMTPTPAQPTRRHGLGAGDWHSGEAMVITRSCEHRREVAELLESQLTKHPDERVTAAWDNASTHEDEETEAMPRDAAGCLVPLPLSTTCSPWLNPAEMLWRHYRREVIHCELFENADAPLAATHAFFDRMNRHPEHTRPVIGATPKEL